MFDGNPSTGSGWTNVPSTKQRTAVQHMIGRLLDALAPEAAPPRVDRTAGPVKRHRTPRGCILQGASGAVTVSWFPAPTTDRAFGELQVIAWRGTVSRPGSGGPRPTEAAEIVAQEVLHPVEVDGPGWEWRDAGSRAYDEPALAARCHALLDGQLGEAERTPATITS